MTRVLASTTDLPELATAIERRRVLGLDLYDYMDEGTYVVAPAPHRRHAEVQAALLGLLGPAANAAGLVVAGPVNVGVEDDYRIPDAALLRVGAADQVWLPSDSVAVAIEVLSPGEAPLAKAGFYGAHGVTELWAIDPWQRTVGLWALAGGSPVALDASRVLGPTAADLVAGLWPTER